MQSDRFFNALKGHGALCRLVILPFESHGYSARESVMHVLWETDRWLQSYCVANAGEEPVATEESSNKDTSGAEIKVVGAAGGVTEQPDQEPDRIQIICKSSLW